MSAMIYDPTAQAFVEAETPMIHDPSDGAWKETTGMAYNPDTEAWEEKWGSKKPLWLIKDGKPTCGFHAFVYGNTNYTTTVTIGSNYVSYEHNTSSNSRCAMLTDILIDLTGYTHIRFNTSLSGYSEAVISKSSSWTGWGDANGTAITIRDDLVNKDISEFSGNYYVGIKDYKMNSTTYVYDLWLEP